MREGRACIPCLNGGIICSALPEHRSLISRLARLRRASAGPWPATAVIAASVTSGVLDELVMARALAADARHAWAPHAPTQAPLSVPSAILSASASDTARRHFQQLLRSVPAPAMEPAEAPLPALQRLAGVQHAPEDMAVLEVDMPGPCNWLLGRPPPPRLLLLQGVQDPGNVGTLLRSAWAFGWNGAVLFPGCASPWSDKVLRASRAASAFFPTLAVPAGQEAGVLQRLRAQGARLVATLPAGKQGAELDWTGTSAPSTVLMVGSEGAGLSDVCTAAATHALTLPCSPALPTARPPPLNAGVAGSMAMGMLGPSGLVLPARVPS